MVNINTEMSANIDDTMVLLFYDRYIFHVFYKFIDQKKVSKQINTVLENFLKIPNFGGVFFDFDSRATME